jgi:hypothetical protein
MTFKIVGAAFQNMAKFGFEYPSELPLILELEPSYSGVRGSVVGWGTMLQAGRSWVRLPMRPLEFSINIILPAALCPWGRLSL